MLGMIECRIWRGWQGWDGWMTQWLNGHEFKQAPGDGEGQGIPVSMRLQRVRYNLGTEQQQHCYMKIADI